MSARQGWVQMPASAADDFTISVRAGSQLFYSDAQARARLGKTAVLATATAEDVDPGLVVDTITLDAETVAFRVLATASGAFALVLGGTENGVAVTERLRLRFVVQ